MIFEVEVFRGMKKGNIEWNANVSFHFKKIQQMWLVKLSVIWFYRCLLFIYKCRFSNFLVTVASILWLSPSQKNMFIYFIKHCQRFCKAELVLTLPDVSSNVSRWKVYKSRSGIWSRNLGPVQGFWTRKSCRSGRE